MKKDRKEKHVRRDVQMKEAEAGVSVMRFHSCETRGFPEPLQKVKDTTSSDLADDHLSVSRRRGELEQDYK